MLSDIRGIIIGEFYDDNPEQYSYRDSHAMDAESDSQDVELSGGSSGTQIHEAVRYEGSTVGTTAAYLLTVPVRQVVQAVATLQMEGLVLEIPFAEQDDPPDEDAMFAAS